MADNKFMYGDESEMWHDGTRQFYHVQVIKPVGREYALRKEGPYASATPGTEVDRAPFRLLEYSEPWSPRKALGGFFSYLVAAFLSLIMPSTVNRAVLGALEDERNQLQEKHNASNGN